MLGISLPNEILLKIDKLVLYLAKILQLCELFLYMTFPLSLILLLILVFPIDLKDG
jgi:hypothetical protein